MSMADFGSFLGGISQGQQQAAQQKERAQYLALLAKRQQDSDQDKSSTAQARFENNFDADPDAAMATDPFGGRPAPGGGAGGPTPPMPGTPSQPMMQPGAGPMPGAPGGAPQVQQRAPMNGNAQPMPPRPQPAPPNAGMPPPGQMPPQAGPGGAPGGMAPPGQQMPPGGPPQPQPQQPQSPEDGYAKARKVLDDVQLKLAEPEAVAVGKDPQVTKDRAAYHSYIEQLKKAGIGPGQGKPDEVQMKRLNLLHDQLSLSSAEASKHLGADRKQQLEFGKAYADTYVKEQAMKNHLQQFEEAEAGRNKRKEMGGSGGAGGTATFGSLSNDALKNLAEDYQKIGPSVLPWARSKGQAGDITKFMNWMAENGYQGGSAGSRADYKSDVKSEGGLQQTADVQTGRYKALDKNVDLMLQKAREYGLSGSTPINTVMNKLRGTSDPKAKDFLAAITTVQKEYGKLADGGSGAAAAHVESLKNAGEIIGGNFTYDQLVQVSKVLKADGKNVIDSYNDQVKAVQARTRKSSKDGGSGAAPAAPAEGGRVVTRAAAEAYAKQSGKTLEEVTAALKARGASVGE